MTEVDINTVPGLIAAIGNHGGMLNKVELWDNHGNKYKFVSVYPHDDLDDVMVLDIVRNSDGTY